MINKAKAIVNKSRNAKNVNATKLKIEAADNSTVTNDTVTSSDGAITQEDVDKAADEGKNIIKDQEVNEASKILENAKDTRDIEKSSSTGEVISVDDYNKKTNITETANEEATIETKNSTTVVTPVTPVK